MRALFFCLLFFMSMISCMQNFTEKPKDLIPESTMEELLYELAILNAARGFSGGKLYQKYDVSTVYLYQKYNIDSIQFANSNMYYASKPEVYINIYKRVEDRLKQVKEQTESARKSKDSLKGQKRRRKRNSKSRDTVNPSIKS